MSQLIVIIYDDMVTADQAGNKILNREKEKNIKFDNVVTAVNKPAGVILNPSVDLVTRGASVGLVLGAITGVAIGLVVGQVIISALIGLIFGAIIGAAAGSKFDYGISKRFMKKVAWAQGPGKSVLFVQTSNDLVDEVIEVLQGTGGELIETTFPASIEERIKTSISSVASEHRMPVSRE